MARAKRRETRGDRVIAFIEGFLKVPEGKDVGKPIKLRGWQKGNIRGIYDGNRAIRRAIISIARKNGKSALCAMLLLVHLVGPEARQNAQIYSAAQSREQAAIVFKLAAKMVRMSPDLEAIVKVRDSAKSLFCTLTGVEYRALSAEHSTAYGLSPALVLHDELGQVRGPQSALYDALETAAGAQAEPLSIIISTQAATDADLLSTLIDDARTGADKRTKLFLFEAPKDAELDDETAWAAATAQADFDIQRNGTSFATMRFAAASDTASFIAASETVLEPGDVLSVIAPSTLDATLADVAFSLAGTLVV